MTSGECGGGRQAGKGVGQCMEDSASPGFAPSCPGSPSIGYAGAQGRSGSQTAHPTSVWGMVRARVEAERLGMKGKASGKAEDKRSALSKTLPREMKEHKKNGFCKRSHGKTQGLE